MHEISMEMVQHGAWKRVLGRTGSCECFALMLSTAKLLTGVENSSIDRSVARAGAGVGVVLGRGPLS